MSSFNGSRVLQKMRERMRSSVVATIHDFDPQTPRLARVVACFNTVDANIGDLFAAVTAALGGKAVPVDGSFRVVHSHSLPTMVGFVRSNAEVLDFDEGSKRGMRAMASNVLMDTSDESLWEVKQAAGAKVLVRQGTEDLNAVLQTAKMQVARAPKLSSVASEVPEASRFVAFVDPRTSTTRYGYVLEASLDAVEILPFPTADERQDDLMLPRVTNDSTELRGEGNVISQRLRDACAPISVGLDNLVETAHLAGQDNFPQIAAPTGGEKEKMIDYYRKVYDYAPDYYQRLVDVIQGHAGL